MVRHFEVHAVTEFARRSSVPVSSVVMSSFLAGKADTADHPWSAGQPGDRHCGDSLTMTGSGWHEPQPLTRLR
jgi:hypothetical protein